MIARIVYISKRYTLMKLVNGATNLGCTIEIRFKMILIWCLPSIFVKLIFAPNI